MMRKQTPSHDFWHRRVEGQIRDVLYSHPEWFTLTASYDKKHFINSLAKRIVGEILAVSQMAEITSGMVDSCACKLGSDDIF